MQISARGILAIEKEEGLRLDSYPDPATGADPWTIGFGHTGSIKRGDKITVEQAREYLQADLKRVEDCINSTVIVLLTQGQFDALCSLIFNIGIGAFRNSTLLRKLNASDYQGAAAQFGVWIKAGGIDYPPLVARRARERAVYDADPVIPAAVPIPIPQTQPFPFPSRFEGDDLILQSEKPMLPIIAALAPGLLQGLASTLISGISSLAQDKISKEMGRHKDKPELSDQLATVMLQTAMTATGKTDPIEATVAAKVDPIIMARVETSALDELTKLAPLIERFAAADDKSRTTALDRNLYLAQVTGGRWLYLLGAIAIMIIIATYIITGFVLFHEGFTSETRALLLGQVVIFGFGSVLAWLFGSNISNRINQQQSSK